LCFWLLFIFGIDMPVFMITPKDPIEYLSALALRLYADNAASLSIALTIAKHVGLTELDGVPVREWYE
jgi:hypothetical protein